MSAPSRADSATSGQKEASAVAAAAAAAATDPSPPAMSELEAALAAYSAANPVDGRKLAAHIAKLQQKFETTKRKASELEEHARVDKDVLRNQLQQLITHLSPEVTKQYCIDDAKIDEQILSDKNGIAHNAVHRVIAACNATFMAAPTSRLAEVLPPAQEEPAKRQKTETAPEPAAERAMAVDDAVDDTDAGLLRRALAAVYD